MTWCNKLGISSNRVESCAQNRAVVLEFARNDNFQVNSHKLSNSFSSSSLELGTCCQSNSCIKDLNHQKQQFRLQISKILFSRAL